MIDARFQQTAHGFVKLTAVRSEAGAWRRCVAGETPHAIVARVMGIDTFSIVTNGELDGLDGLAAGATYGVGLNGLLEVGRTPIVARVVRSTTLLVDLSAASTTSAATDLSGINSAILTLQGSLSALTTAVGTKADNTISITGQFSVTGGGDLTANRQLRLVNDSPNPGYAQYYGTNFRGTKGWFPLVSGPQPLFDRHSAGYTVQMPRDFNGIAARSALGI